MKYFIIKNGMRVDIFVDENNDIAIFTYGTKGQPFEEVDLYGDIEEREVTAEEYNEVYKKDNGFANHPVELKAPYRAEEVAEALKFSVSKENVNPYYYFDNKKIKTLEEMYYGIKGYTKATKGKKIIDIGRNTGWGKYASLNKYDRTGYHGIKLIYLDEKADWIDFDESVIKLINYDPKKDK